MEIKKIKGNIRRIIEKAGHGTNINVVDESMHANGIPNSINIGL